MELPAVVRIFAYDPAVSKSEVGHPPVFLEIGDAFAHGAVSYFQVEPFPPVDQSNDVVKVPGQKDIRRLPTSSATIFSFFLSLPWELWVILSRLFVAVKPR